MINLLDSDMEPSGNTPPVWAPALDGKVRHKPNVPRGVPTGRRRDDVPCRKGLRVLLADDHAMLRDGLKAILTENGFTVIGEASDGHEAIRLAEQLLPDIAVVDISMPLLNGIDSAREILRISPGTRIVLLTMHTEDRFVLASLRAGFSGFVMKSKAASTLVEALDAVGKGEFYLSPGVSRVLVDAYLAKDGSVPARPLSIREREVLQLIAEGKNVKEIGSILGISFKTVESHRANIMQKLNIREVAGLVRYAIRQGLIVPD
jgi:two-component system, NarL family, response regulator NreC